MAGSRPPHTQHSLTPQGGGQALTRDKAHQDLWLAASCQGGGYVHVDGCTRRAHSPLPGAVRPLLPPTELQGPLESLPATQGPAGKHSGKTAIDPIPPI